MLIEAETDVDTVALPLFEGMSRDPRGLGTDGTGFAIPKLAYYAELRSEWVATGVCARVDLEDSKDVIARLTHKEGAMKLPVAGAERNPPGGIGSIVRTRRHPSLRRRQSAHRRGARVWLTIPPGKGPKTLPKWLPTDD